MIRLFLSFLVLVSALASADEVKRPWTATDGRSFEGTFVSATETDVTVRKNGRPVTVPLSTLSAGDRHKADLHLRLLDGSTRL